MGCCCSREASDPPSHYPPVSSPHGHGHDASSRHITASSPPRTSSVASPRGSHSHTHINPAPAAPATSPPSSRPNAALKPLDPTHRSTLPSTLGSPSPGSHQTHIQVTPLSDSTHALWTRTRLDKEREDWWDTRTTGDMEIWGALRVVVGCLQKGEVGEAQAVLDAMECTCPNGLIWRGVFDRRGEWYRVPEWIVVEPEGLVENGEEDSVGGSRKGKEAVHGAVDAEGERKSEELGELVKVRCRLSTDGRDVVVKIHKGDRVDALIANLKVRAKINPFASIRIVYGGKVLEEHRALDSHPLWNFERGHVLVAMVFE